MITVYYTQISHFEAEEIFHKYLERVDEERKSKVMRMQGPEGRLRSLAAGSLLQFGICRKLGIEPFRAAPFSFKQMEGGKPIWPGKEEIHFNLSHSGDYACCAVADQPVGVDIQVCDGLRSALAKRFFTEKDNQRLRECSGQEQENLFYRLWSIKESYIKLTGKGMSQGLSSFEICWDQEKKYADKEETGGEGRIIAEEKTMACFKEEHGIEGYGACLCMFEKEPVCWQEICLK